METRTPDFIFEKKGVYRAYDLKTVFGKASVYSSLQDSIGQCNRIFLLHVSLLSVLIILSFSRKPTKDKTTLVGWL